MTNLTVLGSWISRNQIERAALQVISDYLDMYLRATESLNGVDQGTLPRPANMTLDPVNPDVEGGEVYTSSLHGGLDGRTFDPDDGVAIIVLANPRQDALHANDGSQMQYYQLQVLCLVPAANEYLARFNADLYAAALAEAIVENGDLGGLSSNTMFIEATTGFFDDQVRNLAQATITFNVLICNSLQDSTGIPPTTTIPTSGPEVQSAGVTLTAAPDESP